MIQIKMPDEIYYRLRPGGSKAYTKRGYLKASLRTSGWWNKGGRVLRAKVVEWEDVTDEFYDKDGNLL